MKIALTVASIALLLCSCANQQRIPYSAAESASARVLDLADLRRYADEPPSAFRDDRPRVAALAAQSRTYLALSGGGADGAYGAGVLSGWSDAGTRPEFSIVSGVSTGALIAPFAFLGSAYDETLRQLYTSGVAESLLESPNPLNAIFGSGLFGNTKLRDLLARYVDAGFVSSIAAEHAKGRALLIVTTDMDSQRTAIWDMGRIAALGTPDSVRLFRDVMAASASIPIVFPPILVEAEANGRRFQEMHADGGVTAPVLTLPEAYLLRDANIGKGRNLQLYVLINNKVDRDFQLVPNNTIDIAARTSATVTKTQTRSILFSTYAFTRRNRMDFNLTYIESDRPAAPSAGFDTAYMRALFDYGYERARHGQLWMKAPPSDTPPVASSRPMTPQVAAN